MAKHPNRPSESKVDPTFVRSQPGVGAKPATSTRSMSRRKLDEHIAAYTLLAPALLLLGIWFAYPIISSFILSFQSVNIFHFSDRQFVGWDNYAQLFRDPIFFNTIRITLTFVLMVVPAQTVLALFAAVILQSTGKAKVFYRTAFFVPYITSTVAVTTVFMQLFTAGRALPAFLSNFGLPNTTWYTDVNLALVFLAIIYVWMNIGLYMVVFLGGLQTVPASLYEAATVDGAGAWQRFLHITVPMLRPFTFFVLVSGMIQAFQVFDQVYVVSGGSVLGGPAGVTTTIVVFIFAQAFRYNKLGYGSSAAVILLAVVALATIVLRRIFREEAVDAS